MKKILKLKFLLALRTIGLFLFILCSFNFTFEVSDEGITFLQHAHAGYFRDEAVDKLSKATKYIVHIFFVIPFSWLATFGADMAGALIDPAILNAIFLEKGSSAALYNIWTFIRDLFNIFFIFVLLFSAFATIFQVQKYHLLKSNVLVMIIIMALLVNFSWPITRAIMDAGNVTMFYLIDTLLEAPENAPKGEYIFGSLIEDTRLIELLTLSGPENETAYDNATIIDQIGSAVFLLFFAITFLTIAIIFLIRTTIFVILLVFSPVGFAATIFPGTKRFATMWWSNMLKWTFIGPMMIFMVFISTVYILMMRSLSTEINGNGFSSSVLVTNGIIYLSGLVMLWSGMLVADKMGGAAAKFATSRATKTRNFAMKNYHRIPLKVAKVGGGAAVGATAMAANYASGGAIGRKASAVSGAVSGKLKNIKKNYYSKQKEEYQRERDLAEKRAQGGHYATSAEKEDQAKYEEDLRGPGTDVNVLIRKADIKNKNENEREAARNLLMEQERDSDDKKTSKYRIKTGEQLSDAIAAVRDDTDAVAALLKNADKDFFKDGKSNTLYSNLQYSINNSLSNDAETQKRAKKQTAKLNKKFVDTGRADIVYDYYKSAGDPDAAKNAIGKLNTVKDIAKQEKLLEKLASNGSGQYNDIKVYIDPIIDSPSLRTEFIKSANKKTRQVFKTDILAVEQAENASDLARFELKTVNSELATLDYISAPSQADLDRKTALRARKAHLTGIITPKKT